MKNAEWLMWEAIASPSTQHPPQEIEFDSNDKLLQQVKTFNVEEEDEVIKEIECDLEGDSDLPVKQTLSHLLVWGLQQATPNLYAAVGCCISL